MPSSSGPEPPRRHLERSRRAPEASREHPLEPQERPRRPNWVSGGSQKHPRATKTETKTRQNRVSDGKCRFSEKYAFSQETVVSHVREHQNLTQIVPRHPHKPTSTTFCDQSRSKRRPGATIWRFELFQGRPKNAQDALKVPQEPPRRFLTPSRF